MKRGWVVDADFEVGSNGRGCDIVATNTVPRLCIGVCRASLIATVVSLAVAVAYERALVSRDAVAGGAHAAPYR
jgi:hypothetical protein